MWSIEAHEVLEIIHEEGDEEYVPLEKKSKQRKQSWTEKNMLEALNCCKNQELGIEEASILYGIPKRSLRARLKDKNFSLIDEKYRVFVPPIVPPEAELELVDYLEELIKSQFTLSSVEVRRIAYELFSEKYGAERLPPEKDCLVGNRWYCKFAAKHPHLETETGETFYNSLESLITEHGIDADRIFSVDGLELKFRATDSHDFDSIYHRRKIIYTDSKAICCISASGLFLPPVFVQPDEKTEECCDFKTGTDSDGDGGLLPTAEEVASIKTRIKAHLKRKVQPEENDEELRETLYEQFSKLRNKIVARYEDSLNGITVEMFQDWLIEFVRRMNPSRERRVLLLVGDQGYVKSLKTIRFARENGVVFLVLPPRMAHKIRPLDGFTMSLNRNLSTCASVWLGKNPDFKIQEVPLRELFERAYRNTVNPTIAKNGFVYSGIWPVNRNVFESTELGGESALLKNRMTTNAPETSRCGIDPGVIGSAKAIDIGKLCRVCMKEKMYMKPLFESDEANYYGKKIAEIVKKEISLQDGLPRHICQYCLVQLKDAVKIRNVAVESNDKLVKLKQTMRGCLYESNEDISPSECNSKKESNTNLLEKLLTRDLDVHSICRICLSERPLLTSVFRGSKACPNLNPDLGSRIATVSDHQVRVEVHSLICPFCRTSVNQAWEFMEKAVSSDRRFREILGENP